jgi:thymidylate synthase (FAD)
METVKMYDILEGKNLLIDGLLDGKGSVQLVDVSPRIVPEGYTSEYRAVQSARVSFALGLKDPMTDSKLLRYLIMNYHTSPLEMVNATFRVVCPLAVCVHFLRHRTGHFNQFSMRYAEVPEEENFYDPLKYEHGIREGSKLNKQSSVDIKDEKKIEELKETLEKANILTREIRSVYHKLVDQGLGKEIARFYLPNSEYTTIYMQFDLNNLMKMLSLRADSHTQHETQVYAQAMMDLVEPIFPISIGVLKERMNGFGLLPSEVEVLKGEKSIDSIKSISEKKALLEKAVALGIEL